MMTPAIAASAAAVVPPEHWRRPVKPARTEPWTVAEILRKLERSDLMVERSLIQLYRRQTGDERDQHTTVEDNGVGFNAFDAAFLTDVAQWVERSTYPEGQRLTERQRNAVRKALRKYAVQLTRIANGEV